jgi:hypothetical protein
MMGVASALAGVRAEDSPLVKRGKASTAYVDILDAAGKPAGSATAFCIDASGVFVTNNHVVEGVRTGGRLSLVLNSGEAGQRAVDATVLNTDLESDLALLQATGPGPFTPLTLGETNSLFETTRLTAFGYPLGKELSVRRDTYPTITVTVGRVTALRKSKGVLEDIQLDTTLNPGNSGGPMLDDKGNVIGVSKSIIPGAALSFAVPVEKVKALLNVPSIVFSPATVAFDQRSEPLDLSVELKPPKGTSDVRYSVELSLPGAAGPRTFSLKAATTSRYVVTAAPLERDSRLSQNEIPYTLTIKNGSVLVRESRGVIVLTGLIARDATKTNITAPTLAADRTTLKLPSPAGNVLFGGGGRYLILELRAARQLAIFDVTTAKISYLPMSSDNIRIAAGMDKLFVLLPDSKQIERWNLWTMKQEVATRLETTDSPYAMAIGYASSGPLLMLSAKGPSFYDIDTLKSIAVSVSNIGGWEGASLEVRASADGKTFTTFPRSPATPGIAVLTLKGGSATGRLQYRSDSPAIPSNDGTMIFMDRGASDSELRPLAQAQLNTMACLPSTDPDFFMGFAQGPVERPTGGARTIENLALQAFSTADRHPLFKVNNLDELTQAEPRTAALEKRVFWIPQADLLVTLTASRDELVLRKVNILAEAEKSGVDYLFVASAPPPASRRGESFRYAIQVKSRKGSPTYKLETRIPGMTITADGVVTWSIPQTAPDNTAVTVSIRDASGQEIYHNFTIRAY